MPTSLGWLVGVVDAAMQGWTPHDKETAVARTGLRCEDTQGSGLVDTSNSKKAVVGGNVDDRPFSARRIKESRATPGAAKAAFGDLEQRTADYEEGFVDGALSATKMAADRLGKACGQVLELEGIIRRRDAAIGELQREKAKILEDQKRRMMATLLMLEQKYDEFDAEMEGQLRAKEAAAMVEAEAQRKAQLAEMAANYATEAEQKASRRRKRRRMRGRGRARVKEKGGSVQLNPATEEGQEGGAGQETKNAAAVNGIEVEVSSKVREE